MYTEATGKATRLLLALGQSTGLSRQGGRRWVLRQAPRDEDLCQVGKDGHLLPACPLPAASAYISSMYSTVVLGSPTGRAVCS